jgi:hypothetical protein
MGGSQHPRIMVASKCHEPLSQQRMSDPRTYELSALLLWEVQISQINHIDGITSWTLSMQNAEIFVIGLAGSGDRVAYGLQWKRCSIISWTLYYQYLEIPHTFFHTLTSRIIWDLHSNMVWFGTLTHNAVIFKHEFLSFSLIKNYVVPSWLCLETVIWNLHKTYQCQMYNRKLLMMGREDSQNM